MSNFAELKALINRDIRQNSVQAITGEVLNAVLNSMVVSIGSNYSYAGIISPIIDTGEPDANVFYISTTPGVYPYQGNLTMSKPIGIFKWNGVWSLDELDLDFDSAIEEERNARIAADNALMVVDNNLQSQITGNASDIDDIEALIPAEATASNQLADKDFVNSSIATNTATFVGTFETSADLPTSGVKNNDYAFVVVDGEYARYKYNGSAWVFEYTLNNSSFTAAQWAAVNSGITAAILQDIQLDLANLPPFTWDSVNGVWKFGGNLVVQGGLALENFNYSGGGGGTSYTQKSWAEIQLMTSDVVGSLASAYAVKQAYDQLASLSTNVSFSQTQTSGTLIGVITIDGSAKNIYAPSLSGYATEDWVLGKGYITSAAIPSYLPNPYSLTFGNKSYNGSSAVILTASDIGALTQHQSLDGYATEEWVQSLGYITSAALAGYATESWVESQNYLTSVTWSAILNKPAFAAVATSGSYNDLSNKPTIATLMGSSAVGGASSYAYWTGSAWSSKSLGSFAFISSLDWSSIGNRPPFTWDSSAGAWRLAANLIVEGGLALEDLEYSGGGGTTYTQRNWTYIQGMTGDVGGDLASAYAVKQAYDQLAAMSTNVSFSQSQTGGTLIGVITIDDVAQNIYAPTIPTSLKNPYALTFGSKTYDGSAARTILASDLGALTAHQSIYTLTFAAGAFAAGSFVANSAAKTINVPTHTSHLTNNSGYITADDIPTTIAWGNVTGKPTFAAVATSGSYNDLSNKPTIPSIAGLASESWVSNNFLGLGGGTLTGYLKIQKADGDCALLLGTKGRVYYMESTLETVLYNGGDGYPAVKVRAGTGHPIFRYGSVDYPILHEGNVGEYALPIDGSATMTGALHLERRTTGTVNVGINDGLFLYRGPSTGGVDIGLPGDYYNLLNIGATGMFSNLQLSWLRVTTPRIFARTQDADNYGSWRELAFTDSNVASATKLATARTIWGQSFDGTGNVDGDIQLSNNASIIGAGSRNAFKTSGTDLYIGSGYTASGDRTFLYGNVIRMYAGTGSQAVFINSSGNVTIGASDLAGTDYKLVSGGNTYIKGTLQQEVSSAIINTNATLATSAMIDFKQSGRGMLASISATYDTANWSASNVAAGSLRFSTYNHDESGVRMTIAKNGNVLIGTTADSGYKLDVAGTLRATGAATFAGNISAVAGTFSGTLDAAGVIHSSTGIWTDGWLSFSDLSSTSDARFKKDIKAISSRDALRIIKALKPCSWTWNELSKTQGRGLGFIAQEMQGILPEAIREIGYDKHLAINYQMLHALEVASIQKHEDEITRLRRRVESLEKEIQRLTTFN